MRIILILFYGFVALNMQSQVIDDFSDGNFTFNPTWTGNTSEFTVNSNQELQLNSSGSSSSYLSLSNNLSSLDNKEWRIWVKQSFSPSSSNNSKIYLSANNSDLSLVTDGYYLQLGESGSNDAIRLFKLDNSSATEICAGTNGQISSSFDVSIKVTRNNSGEWSLYTDFSGGQNYTLQSTSNDASNLLGSNFGVLCNYTSSNASKFYFDDVFIGDLQVDSIPPQIQSVSTPNATTIDVLFNEALNQTSAENISNYSLLPSIGIVSALRDGSNYSLVHLSLSSSLTNGTNYDLTSQNIEDLFGNISSSQSINFSYLVADTPTRGDIIINEFFADPSPSIGLPEQEFIELYNKSNKILNLDGWKIQDASSSGTINQKWIMPNEYVVLCANADTALFSNSVGVTSFPSLNNTSDQIILKLGNLVLDSINYTDDWYKDENKKNGGYSIELINPNDPCSDIDNWAGSNWISGGTPGIINSVYNTTPDVTPAEFESLNAASPNYLEIVFTENMDSSSLVNAPVLFNPNLTIQNKYVTAAYSTSLTLQFNETLTPSSPYLITITGTQDCWQNSASLSGYFTLPEDADSGDIVINEIMHNPITGGSDWIELYNNSNKVIDIKDWVFANFDDDTISNQKSINNHFILHPDTYVVVGNDSNFVLQNYPYSAPGRFTDSDLPSYSNDSGTVYLIYNNIVHDKVSYNADWHFELLDSEDGVSLERTDPNLSSNSYSNWHSCAEAYSFASPGVQNSQYMAALYNGDFNFTNNIISPDNDGFQDILQINYQMTEPGLLGNVVIYDDRGRLIKTLLKNELLGMQNSISWDGVKSNGTKASIGTYVVTFEAFSSTGGTFFSKRKAFTVAGKL